MWCLTQRLGTEEAEMKIVGCDLDAKQQTIAMVDTETGVSYNAGVVKYFFSTLLRPLRDERHFALVEISAIPTKARS